MIGTTPGVFKVPKGAVFIRVKVAFSFGVGPQKMLTVS